VTLGFAGQDFGESRNRPFSPSSSCFFAKIALTIPVTSIVVNDRGYDRQLEPAAHASINPTELGVPWHNNYLTSFWMRSLNRGADI
jgi:hypothetical protein